MIRNLLILLLTLFQDKYVRTGTLVGLLIGIWNPEILQGEQGKSVIILGFVGWGIGACLPGRQVIRAENSQPFPADPSVTISGFLLLTIFYQDQTAFKDFCRYYNFRKKI